MTETAKQRAAKAGARQPTDRKPKRQPRPSEPRMQFSVGSRTYDIGLEDLTAVESRLFERECGRGPIGVFSSGEFELHHIATLMWLMDRRDDPRLSWEESAQQLSLADFANVEVDGDAGPSS